MTLQYWFMFPIAVLIAMIAMTGGVGVLFILVAILTLSEVLL
jgi:hypothetical protein